MLELRLEEWLLGTRRILDQQKYTWTGRHSFVLAGWEVSQRSGELDETKVYLVVSVWSLGDIFIVKVARLDALRLVMAWPARLSLGCSHAPPRRITGAWCKEKHSK